MIYVYWLYTAMSWMQKFVRLYSKNAITLNMQCHKCKNLLNHTQKCKNIGHFSWISYRVYYIQHGPYSTSVYCVSLYTRRRVPGDFIHLVDVYSNVLYVHLYIGSKYTCTTCSINIILILQTDQPKEMTEGIEKVLESLTEKATSW